jgi:two-component system, NtrC family, sensor histidine kinase KinB
MLRTRLVLGLLCLLIILLAMGLYSIDRCSNLGGQIQLILSEQVETVKTIQEIRQCINQSTDLILEENPSGIANREKSFEKTCVTFNTTTEKLKQTTIAENANSLIEKLKKNHQIFRRMGQAYIILPQQKNVERHKLAQQITRKSQDMIEQADYLLEHFQKATQSRSGISKEDVNTTIRLMIFAMIIAVVVAIYASVRLSRGLLDPLSTLATSIQKVGQGNLDQNLVAKSNDELGMLARSFNEMARQLKGYRDTDQSKLGRLNRTIKQTLSSFPDPIFVLNQNQEVEFRNPSADEFAIKLLFSGVDRLPEQLEKLVCQVLDSGQDFLPSLAKDSIRFNFDNRAHFYLPRIVLLREESGTLFGVAVILEDITQARLLDDIKTNLISTVSHELKTPITSLRTSLHLLLEKESEPLTKLQGKLVKTARDETERLLSILKDLLDLTRLEQGIPDFNFEEAHPRTVLESALESVSEFTRDALVRIRIQVDENLPNVRVDRQRIAYVFNNLLTNALKYSTPGTPIEVYASKNADGFIEFSIRDQGPGISPDHLPHVFEKFYRVPGAGKSGSGLGLSIAQEIARAHQGNISVISTLGQGSVFVIILPSTNC